MTSNAVFEGPERKYRYILSRIWNPAKPIATFVMLNPAKADDQNNDQTISRCINIATQNGFGGLYIVNLFGYRSSNPKDLLTVEDPIGLDNDVWVKFAVSACKVVIFAWGNSIPKKLNKRLLEVVDNICMIIAGNDNYQKIRCLGRNKNGTPKHPMMLPNNTNLEVF